MTFLIDTSHYNGAINWTQVKADGCVGAYVKVADGVSGVDAMWQTNHAGATGVGLPVGPYHFAEGGNVSAEAAHFASVWSAGWQLHPVLDYEIASANAGWLTAFRTYFRQDSGFDPFRVYTSEGFLTGQLNPAGWVDADTTIWAARYNSTLGWTHPALVLWQNTSAARIPGILGNVDEDQFQNGWTPAADTGGNVTTLDDTFQPIDGSGKPVGQPVTIAYAIEQIYGGLFYGGASTGGLSLFEHVDQVDSDVKTQVAAVLAAVQGVQAGTVDVAQLAQALVPILAPADATAFQAALATALAK